MSKQALDPFSFANYDNVLGFVVARTAFMLGRTLVKRFKRAGANLTPQEFALLNRVAEYDGINQTELANLTYKDKPAVTRLLDGMIKKNLVQKILCDSDRRAYNVSLSEDGRQLRRKLVPVARTMLKQASRDISDADLETTVRTLQALYRNLEKIDK